MVFCYDRLSRQIQVSFLDGQDSNNGNKNFSCIKETSLFLHAHIHTLKFFFNYVKKPRIWFGVDTEKQSQRGWWRWWGFSSTPTQREVRLKHREMALGKCNFSKPWLLFFHGGDENRMEKLIKQLRVKDISCPWFKPGNALDSFLVRSQKHQKGAVIFHLVLTIFLWHNECHCL